MVFAAQFSICFGWSGSNESLSLVSSLSCVNLLWCTAAYVEHCLWMWLN